MLSKMILPKMKCFEKFFDLSLNQKPKPKFRTECWATYNYARAINCSNSSQNKQEVVTKCHKVLKSDEISIISEDLKQNLMNELYKLESS